MTYIYDILLNFNRDFYEFYEWEKSDNIIHIKKIPIYKVNSFLLEDIHSNDVKLDNSIGLEIMNKTEIFDSRKVKTLKYSCLLTDSYRTIGILLDDDFKVIKVSDLLKDEEEDAINISRRLNLTCIAYNILGSKKVNNFLTRKEIKIKKYLLAEIKNMYKEKDILKLKYLYFEFFNKNNDNIDLLYKEFINSFESINENHFKLYELVKLCNKKTHNLTN